MFFYWYFFRVLCLAFVLMRTEMKRRAFWARHSMGIKKEKGKKLIIFENLFG